MADLEKEKAVSAIMVELTSAFEGIASTRIAQIKDQVLRGSQFFGELWRIYRQIRVDEQFRFGRLHNPDSVRQKQLMILITSEGSFSGDIDRKLVDFALSKYDEDRNDIMVIGHHGFVQLAQQQVPTLKAFKMPASDHNIDVIPLISEVQKYASTLVYYEAYVSLMNQQIKTIELGQALSKKGAGVKASGEDIISEATYIFEPSTHAVVAHLESSMMLIMLSEVILESKLAQYASRFRAMRVAREKADDAYVDLKWQYNRAGRQLKDERLKEVINGLRGKAEI